MGIIIGIIVVIHGNVKHHIQRYVVICLMCLLILVWSTAGWITTGRNMRSNVGQFWRRCG